MLNGTETSVNNVRLILTFIGFFVPTMLCIKTYLSVDDYTKNIGKNEELKKTSVRKIHILLRVIIANLATIPILLSIVQILNCSPNEETTDFVSFYNSGRTCFESSQFSKFQVISSILCTFYLWLGVTIRKTHFDRRVAHNT